MRNPLLCPGMIVAVLLLMVSATVADVPHLINFQGRATNAAGEPLDGSQSIKFKIYGSSAGSDSLWSSGFRTVTVSDGLFTYALGSDVALPASLFAAGASRWLGVTVGADAEISPRTQLLSVPYAYHAHTSDTASYALAGAGGSSGGWVDGGTVVRLTNSGDSVGIGTTDPAAPLEVVAAGHAIVGHSTGNGTVAGVIGGNDGTGWGVMGSTNTGRGVFGTAYNGFGGYFAGAKNYFSQNLGIGTESPSEMLHVYRSSSGADTYLQLESDHASNCGETGIRFGNHWNTWRLFMDDDSNDELADGGFGLFSDYDAAAPAMSFSANTHVGFGHAPRTAYQVTAAGDANAYYADITGSGIAYHASVASGFGAYMEAPNNYFSGNTGFGTTTPTHEVTVNGELALQGGGATQYHLNYYNGGLNLSETTVADYRLFIKDGGNVGIGTSNPTAKLTVNGSAHVDGTFHADAFEADAIGRANITDEVGIASRTGTGWTLMGDTYESYLSRNIIVPTAGYILAIGSVLGYTTHMGSGASQAWFAISTDSISADDALPATFGLSEECNACYTYFPVPLQRLFFVNAPGAYTFHVVARRSDGSCWIGTRKLDLLFVPTAYSAKEGDEVAIAGDMIPAEIAQNGLDVPEAIPCTASEPAQSSAKDVTDISKRVDALTAELTALKEQLKQVEKK